MLRKRTMAWLGGSVAGGGLLSVAAAAVIFSGTISGSAATAPSAALFFRSGSAVSTADTSGVTCKQVLSGTTGTSGRPPSGYVTTDTLTITKALPGSVCTFNVGVLSSVTGMVLQDVKLVNTVKTGTATPFVAALGKDCKLAVSHTATAPSAVTFTVTSPVTGWVAAQTVDFGIGSALQATPLAEYVAADCS